MEQITNIVFRKISELVPLKENPRTITSKDLDKLVDSIRINGFWEHRPVVLSDRTGKMVVLAGNQRLKAAKKLKMEQVPTVLYQNLTEDDEKEIILRDNINNGQWDPMGLQSDYFAEVDFNFMGLEIPSFGDDEEEPKKKKSKKAKEEPQDPEGEESDRYVVYGGGDVLVAFCKRNGLKCVKHKKSGYE